ncbi:MAG: HlyD family secretion protein [Paraglaciecola sp.]|jgi:HlyD family secretion protein
MIADTQSQDETIPATQKSIPKKWLFILLVVLSLSYVAFPTLSQWYSSIPNVDSENLAIATVMRGELVRDVAVSGKAVAANAPQLYNTEAGQITLLAKPGETVKQNQIVARLVSPELDALIKQQESTLEQLSINSNRGILEDKVAQLDLESNMNAAQSALNVAIREKQRAEISFKKQIISEIDWMKSQDTLADATLFFQHAKKRVDLAKERLEFERKNRDFLVKKQQLILNELVRRHQALEIKTPLTGVVGNWLVAQKNTIAANTAIMTVVDLSEYEAELSVPEFYADDLGLGLTVAMQISGQQINGVIIAISPEIKGNQVKVRAKLISQSSVQLRQNQRINARIEFEKKTNVLMVKRGAFMGSLAGEFAFKKFDDNTAKKIAITTGASSVDYVELTSGVTEDDQIIISDYQDFSHAEQINITD